MDKGISVFDRTERNANQYYPVLLDHPRLPTCKTTSHPHIHDLIHQSVRHMFRLYNLRINSDCSDNTISSIINIYYHTISIHPPTTPPRHKASKRSKFVCFLPSNTLFNPLTAYSLSTNSNDTAFPFSNFIFRITGRNAFRTKAGKANVRL